MTVRFPAADATGSWDTAGPLLVVTNEPTEGTVDSVLEGREFGERVFNPL